MSEFSDRPFVAGSLTGIRAFSVDALGRLTGVTHKQVWLPGENIADCRRVEYGNTWGHGGLVTPGHLVQSIFEWTAPRQRVSLVHAGREAAKKERELASHRPGSLACQCGFYAYFDDAYNNPYDQKDRVRGLVEGYGLVTVGSRGFRAEKAKIVALIISTNRRNALTDRLIANYSGVPVFARRRDALEKFPLVAPPVPTPASDPDFWTRSAS